jgi:hypothetical protein
VDGTIEKLDQWLTLAGSIVPIFFILNFFNERSAAKGLVRDGRLEMVMGLASLVVMIAAPIIGIRFINEALWRNRNPDFVWRGRQGCWQLHLRQRILLVIRVIRCATA